MSKTKIKGLTIQIGGDTTQLSKALKKPNQEANDLQSKLKSVNEALKVDPSNVDLLAQKERLLAQAVETTTDKLNLLKKAQEQFIESGKNVDSAEYIELQRQIASTTKKLNSLKDEQDAMTSSLEKFSKKASEVSQKTGSLSDSFEGLSKGAAGLGTAILATVPASEELRSDLSFLEQNANEANVAMEDATSAFDTFNNVVNETDSSIEGVSNLLQAGFTESNLQKAVEGLTGAYIKFPDTMKIESLADSLQETLATENATGQFAELLDRVGVGAENFSASLQACATDAEKQNLVLKLLAEQGLNDTYASWKEANAELVDSRQANQDLQESIAELAETVTPLMTTATKTLTGLLNVYNSLDPKVQNVILVMIGFVAALSPALKIVSSVTGNLGNLGKMAENMKPILTSLSGTVKTVFSFISNAFKGLMGLIAAHPVIAIVTGIIAVILLLYNKCEWFRDGVNSLLKKVADFFKNGFDNVISILSNAGSFIKNAGLAIVNTLLSVFNIGSKFAEIGSNLISGLWSGISNMKNWILNKISGFTSSIVGGIKGFFGIHSPSKVMADEVGKYVPAGLGKGIIDNEDLALDPLKKLQKEMTSSFNPNMSYEVNKSFESSNYSYFKIPIEVTLDGKPVYKNVISRINRERTLKAVHQGG